MDTVRVILADAGRIAAHAGEIISQIPGYYAAGYQRIKRKQEADQELAAGFLLKEYLGVCRDEQLVRTEHGKPLLRSGEKFFSLSHSGQYAALAISDRDIGLDIEQLRPVHWLTARKVFSREQQRLLERTPEAEQPLRFTCLWTEREAELKLRGTGFAVGLEPSAVGLEPSAASLEPSAAGLEPSAARSVRSARYGDYVVTCAAYEPFDMAIDVEG